MTGKPGEQPQEEKVPPAGVEPAGDAERFGPLTLERMSKEDGRALLVYHLSEGPAR